MEDKQINAFAVTALVCGLVSLFLVLYICLRVLLPGEFVFRGMAMASHFIGILLGIAAIVLGAIAITKRKKDPTMQQRTAIAGIICGSIGVLGGLLLFLI
jgi:hypothetical protein